MKSYYFGVLMSCCFFACSAQVLDPLLDPAARSSFHLLISREQIQEGLKKIAKNIDQDLNGEEVTVIVTLKGALFAAVDLMSCLQSPCVVECVRAGSYGMQGSERGHLTTSGIDALDIQGKNVLIVEDIFDSGVTLSALAAQLEKLGPKTLRSFALLVKNVPHLTEYRPDYSLFDIGDDFVIGYGLDYKERWRHLPGIFIAK